MLVSLSGGLHEHLHRLAGGPRLIVADDHSEVDEAYGELGARASVLLAYLKAIEESQAEPEHDWIFVDAAYLLAAATGLRLRLAERQLASVGALRDAATLANARRDLERSTWSDGGVPGMSPGRHLARRRPVCVEPRTALPPAHGPWRGLVQYVATPIVIALITAGGGIGAAKIADNASCEPQIKATRTTTEKPNGQSETTTTEERIRCPK